MVGIIDIGTNTIRMVVYENGKIISNTALKSEILHDTENGYLTKLGTEKLIKILLYFISNLPEMKIYAFATFAFRKLCNKEEVKKEIFEKIGISIDILTGMDEAECDFLAISDKVSYNESGIGIDLGGGSAQIFYFENNKLGTYNSYPIGCNLIQKIFGFGALPDKSDSEKANNYIEGEICDFGKKADKLYIMGGSAKCAAVILKKLHNEFNEEITFKEIDEIENYIKNTPENEVRRLIGNRFENILTGLLIIKKVAETVCAKKIVIKTVSVRDGYMKKLKIKG